MTEGLAINMAGRYLVVIKRTKGYIRASVDDIEVPGAEAIHAVQLGTEWFYGTERFYGLMISTVRVTFENEAINHFFVRGVLTNRCTLYRTKELARN